jgi:hypothetical protein
MIQCCSVLLKLPGVTTTKGAVTNRLMMMMLMMMRQELLKQLFWTVLSWHMASIFQVSCSGCNELNARANGRCPTHAWFTALYNQQLIQFNVSNAENGCLILSTWSSLYGAFGRCPPGKSRMLDRSFGRCTEIMLDGIDALHTVQNFRDCELPQRSGWMLIMWSKQIMSARSRTATWAAEFTVDIDLISIRGDQAHNHRISIINS